MVFRKTGKRQLSKFDSKKGKQGKAGHRARGGVRTKTSPESFLPTSTTVSCEIAHQVNVTEDDLRKLQRDSNRLKSLETVDGEKMLTPEQEQLCTKFIKHKLKQSTQKCEHKDRGVIQARNKGGAPITLQRITDPRKTTCEASQRTLSERNRKSLDYERLTTCPSNSTDDEIIQSVMMQRAAQMKSHRHAWAT